MNRLERREEARRIARLPKGQRKEARRNLKGNRIRDGRKLRREEDA